MLVIANQNSRLGWMLGRLANRRSRILDLVRRLNGLGHPAGFKPSLFAKFLHMLDDVAAASKEETAIIGRIEDIEQKHRLMRACKGLRQAGSAAQTATFSANRDEPKVSAKSGFSRLFKLIVLWHLFMRQKINQKKQSLTVD